MHLFKLNTRKLVLLKMGELFQNYDWSEEISQATQANPWFTEANILVAMSGWSETLTQNNLSIWLRNYKLPELISKSRVQLILAGNIPLVGLHDILCTFISGKIAEVKLSSKDKILIPALLQLLEADFPGLNDRIRISDHLADNPDMVLSTGSDNTRSTMMFEFQNIPGIFRANRNSAAILSGNESDEDLNKLSTDIRLYFGLGCRNVCHLLIPNPEALDRVINSLKNTAEKQTNQAYLNNQNQQKAIFTLKNDTFYEAGDILILAADTLSSPVGVVTFQFYEHPDHAQSWIIRNQDEIQCIVGNIPNIPTLIPFGQSQFPELWDYADNIDTIDFLLQGLKDE